MGSKRGKLGTAVAAALACAMTTALAVPFLVLAAGGIGRSNGESCAVPAAEDAGSTILGESALDAGALDAWWTDQHRGQPAGLSADVAEVAELYIHEGELEGVRGDLAFAQAVHETGYFTSLDTGRNNFAGIGHPHGAQAGRRFPTVEVGVRAHIQLLKKFAAGNDAPLASRDVAPQAGANATTWPGLAGTWASDPDYWRSIASIYEDMGAEVPVAAADDPCLSDEPEQPRPAPAPGGPTDLATVGGITVSASIADQLVQLLDAARADGLLLNGSGYRSHERQIELRESHCGTSHYAIYEMPSSQCSPPTARPGNSQHEVGLAIDFVNCSSHSTACWQWLNTHATTYGFFNLASEPWHWSSTGR